MDSDKKERQLINRLNKFSGSLMSNVKWIKVFKKLSENKDLISKCLMKDVHDNVLRQIHIPTIDNFTSEFYDKGFKDSGRNQPYRFKEIEWIEFVSDWTIARKMRGQALEPHKYNQDILKIREILQNIGQLEIELSNDKLIIYGYK